jgi:hypothetical protein
MILYDYKHDDETGESRTQIVISPLWIFIFVAIITGLVYWVW